MRTTEDKRGYFTLSTLNFYCCNMNLKGSKVADIEHNYNWNDKQIQLTLQKP